MDSEEVKISVGGLIFQLVLIAALFFVLVKSRAALNRANSELEVVEPIWKTGVATSGTATAEGPITKTRLFFKAQGVLLEYNVDGTQYSCHTRMLKKDFDKLDGEKKERDGRADVLLRYNPIDPSKAATEQSVSILKNEKNSYNALKWISIIYLFISVFSFVYTIISTIGYSIEQRKKEKDKRKKMEEAERARQAAAERARQAAAERARQAAAEKERQAAAERARREAEEKERQAAAERARREAEEKERQAAAERARREAEEKSRKEAEEKAKKAAAERARQEATIYDADPSFPTDDGTVFDADPSFSAGDRTIYDADPSFPADGGTVYDADPSADGGTIYDADPSFPADDGTVFDADIFSAGDDGTVYDADASSLSDDTYQIVSDPIYGGMGSVWKVHHKDWDVDLAMKRPKAEYFKSEKQKADFIGECEAWINLGIHPNIVACYYVREMDGVPTIFSEWMENGSLESRISDGTLYNGSDADVSERLLDIAIQFAEGLHYAHRSLLVHRDVKPANLLLTNDWEARVADFGIAQLGRKKAGEYVMTPAYCSPEQAAGKKLSRKTDIYSWAVSVLEMYLRYRPWQHGTVAGMECRHYFDMAKTELPEKMRVLLEKCLENEAKNRPKDFASVIRELKGIYKDVTGRTYPRPAARVSSESADKLNNRALSYLDLNRESETEDLWIKAALMEPAHTETLFNRCLHGYRSGSMTLYEAQCFLSANWENHFNQAEPGLLLAELSLEGGDLVNAKDVLSYVRNYSSQQEELSEQTEERLEKLEKAASAGSGWRCSYQLSRVKNYKQQEELQKERDKRLRELKNLVKKGKWDEAGKELMISHLTRAYGNVLYQEDWLEFYEELSRKCTPVVVLGQWPIMTVSGMRRHDRVSFSDDSKYLLCGQKLFNLENGQMIRDNGFGYDSVSNMLASALSPDGSFYLCANKGGTRFIKVNARTGETLAVCAGHEQNITALAISRDGQYFASGDEGGTLKLWDRDGKLIRTSKFSMGSDEPLEDIQFGYDYRKMVLRHENYVILSDQAEGSMDTIKYDNYLELAVDLGYTALGMAAGRKGLRYMDLETKKERVLNDQDAVRRRGRGISTASQVSFMHNQRYLLASDSSILYFFDPENDKILSAIHMGENFESIAISRNGKYIAAISGGKAQLWRCIYGLRYSEEMGTDEIVEQCAHVQCSAHPELSPEQLLEPLMEELADRGYGAVESAAALEALRSAQG